MEEKMNKKSLQQTSSLYDDTLYISVENIGELENLINNIQEKEKALQGAVQELKKFQLKVSFTNK